MALQNPEMVLFDLDGTLVDSAPDLAFAIDTTMEQLGLPKRGIDKVRCWIGNGLERTVKRALLNEMHGEPDPVLFDHAYRTFLDIYSASSGRLSRIYDGATDSLDYLKKNDFNIGCVTNKRKQFTVSLLKELGIFDDFGIVISGDSLPQMKPDPLPLLHAARHFNAKPENSLMVGDSLNDVQAARAAGLKVVCVTYGYNHGQDIRIHQPDAVLDSLAELPQLLNA